MAVLRFNKIPVIFALLFVIAVSPFVITDVYAITIVDIKDQASCNALVGIETWTVSSKTCTLNNNHRMPPDTRWDVTGGVTLVNDATLTVCNDCQLFFQTLGVLHRNNGDIQNNGEVTISGFGTAILENYGSINNKVGSLLRVGGQLNNQGIGVINNIEFSGSSIIDIVDFGLLQNMGTLDSRRTITISGGTLWNNGGTIHLLDGTLSNSDKIRNEGELRNEATITNWGTIENTHANALINNIFGEINGNGIFNSKIQNLKTGSDVITNTVTITNTNLPNDPFDPTPLTINLSYPAKIPAGQSFNIGSTRELTITKTFTNEGTIDIRSDALVRIVGPNGQMDNIDTINNSGEVDIGTGRTVENSGTFNLLCGGTVTGSGVVNGNPITFTCDSDGDGVVDVLDNCPADNNPGQENNDGDTFGDVCDPDDDNDLVLDGDDNCQFIANSLQEDTDGSGIGDACNDADDLDGDEYETAFDNCPAVANPTQLNTDGDLLGDSCDADDDNDNILDTIDDMPTDFSNIFSDKATTSGEILDRGDQQDDLTISDEADPEGVGFDVDAGGGAAPAKIFVCSNLAELSLDSGDSGTITCGSVTVSIISGSVDVQFNIGSGSSPATTTMGLGSSLTFDDKTLKFTNNSGTSVAVIKIGNKTITLSPGETFTVTFSSSGYSYQDPNLGDVRHGQGHDNGFCMNQNCINVDGFFNHFPETIVSQGSTHTFTVLVNCPRGANTCNHISIAGALPDADFYDYQWAATVDRQTRSDNWVLTTNNPFGEIGDVTVTVQTVSQSFISATFNIPFLIPGSVGTHDGIGDPQENNRHLHVTVWDNNRGMSNYIFNEGVYVDDIYAYPQAEASFDDPLKYESLCLNENVNKRYTCAFDKVREWTIKNAEQKLQEIYETHNYKTDSELN